MRIIINTTFECNLKCEYCYLHSKNTKSVIDECKYQYRKPNEWIEGILWLEKQFEEISVIDISGGEPFLYKGIIELIKKIPERIIIGITTNTLLISESFFLLPDEKKKKICIVLSAHLVDGKLPDVFIKKIIDIKNNFRNININFVTYPRQDDFINYIKEISDRIGIRISFEPYIDYNSEKKHFGFTDYASLFFSPYDRRGIELSNKRKLPSECFIGTKYLWITPDGNINQCLGRFLERKEPIGNIFKKEMHKRPESVISCDIFCPCTQNWRDDNQ